VLRVTPNHPVLTADGWKPANLVHIGDKVFASNVAPSKAIANDQKHHAVTTAEDVFRAFRESPAMLSVEVPTTAPDFHGDASAANGAEQIAIVLADRELLLAVNPGLLKTLLDLSLKRSNPAASGGSHLDQRLLASCATTNSFVSGGSKGFALGSGSATHAGKLLLAPVAQLATGFNDDALNGTWRDAEAIRDAANTDALIEQGYDQTDVCWIGREPFSGHVYNFETETGTYYANSILTHNCRSTTVPVIDYEGLGFDAPPSVTKGKRASADGPVPVNTSYGQWLKDQPRSVQEDVLGPGKVPYFNRLVDKYGAKDAMARLVRDDGSELTLEQLRKRYGPA
jgi:hypothetical protein